MHYNHPPFLLLLFFSLPTQLPLAARLPDFSLDLVSPFSCNNNNSVCKPFESEIEASGETYLMSVELSMSSGGETRKTLAIADTGSDLVWLDGIDCKGEGCHCKEKNTAQCIDMPITYSCNEKWCDPLKKLPGERETPECTKDSCLYDTSYGDGFTTAGKLTKGYFKLAKNDEKKKVLIMFGVSTESNGRMDENSAGIIGLGKGDLSLVSQLSKNCDFRFSYCLIHPNSPKSSHKRSKLRFGPQVTISKNSTELLTEDDNEHCKNRYCVKLERISVKDHVQVKGTHTHNIIEVSKEDSVMMIDTGTTHTFLRENLFDEFIKEVKRVVGEEEAEMPGCFKRKNGEKLKSVSLEFKGDLTVELKRDNIFVLNNSEYLCLTVKRQKKKNQELKLNLLGSWAQTNFNVTIGVQGKEWKASFDEEECSGHYEPLHFQE